MTLVGFRCDVGRLPVVGNDDRQLIRFAAHLAIFDVVLHGQTGSIDDNDVFGKAERTDEGALDLHTPR